MERNSFYFNGLHVMLFICAAFFLFFFSVCKITDTVSMYKTPLAILRNHERDLATTIRDLYLNVCLFLQYVLNPLEPHTSGPHFMFISVPMATYHLDRTN